VPLGETVRVPAILRQLIGKKFQCDEAAKLSVFSLVDHAHAASEFLNDAVVREWFGRPARRSPLAFIGLPNDLDPFVPSELFIRSEDGNIFGQSLRDNFAIKRIGVMEGKSEELKRVVRRVG
jgi:hypothetical protein